jgi:hypothetical protein
MARVNWTEVDRRMLGAGMPMERGAHVLWPTYYSAAALLQRPVTRLTHAPVRRSTDVLIPGEEWTNQRVFSTTRIYAPTMLHPQLMVIVNTVSAADKPLPPKVSMIQTTLATTILHFMTFLGPCPPSYGPEQVFVRRYDGTPPDGISIIKVPRWAFWLVAYATRLIAFHWKTGTTTLASRDGSQLYLHLLGAIRFRAFELPDDPPGYTYGIPRPDGTWFLPNAAYDGSPGACPGTYL